MQQHVQDRYKSRNIVLWEQPLPCELCLYNLIQWKKDWVKVMNDIHHIESSNRGKRKHNKDGSDIVWLCCQHHSYIIETMVGKIDKNYLKSYKKWLVYIVECDVKRNYGS